MTEASKTKEDRSKQNLGVVRSTGKAAFNFKTSEHTEVEVGDPAAEQFTPKLALYKWNREVHLKLHPCLGLQATPQSLQGPPGQNRGNIAAPRLDQNRITHSAGPVTHKFYPLEPTEDMEEGGVEFEFTLNEKPDCNSFVFPIETRNLVFYYQPELTDDEKNSGFNRPENVVGSYAVYHAQRGNAHPSEALAQKYKTGKAFHIYRPKATDAQGRNVWATLNIDPDQGTLTVTIDQAFLDTAAYPVTVDPTFGYTGAGASSTGVPNRIITGLFTTPVCAGNHASKITVRMAADTYPHAKCGFYNDSTRAFLQGTVEQVSLVVASLSWVDFTFSPTYTLPDTLDVDMCVWTDCNDYSGFFRYDSGSGTNRYHNQTYGAWPDPVASWSTNYPGLIRFSIYCTYTADTVPLTVVASLYGTTSPVAGVSCQTTDSNVPVTATPVDSNHVLNSWILDGVNVGSANPYTVTMDQAHTLEPVIFPAILGAALADLDALVTWATPAHQANTFFFGALFEHYAVADLLTEATYQNGLATTAGYLAALAICRIAKVRGIPNAAMVTQQKAAMNALTFFTGKHWPITGTFTAGPHGSGDCCLEGYYGFSNDFQLSKLLDYLATKWNNHLAWQELEAVCHAAGDIGILEMDPSTLEYYSVDRFYDENALSINLLVELYMLDPDNNAVALTYALTLWTHINTAMWNLAGGANGFSYRPTVPGFECEGGFFPQVIMKLYAANGYTLTNFSRMLTDLHTRFLSSGWSAVQWNYSGTCYYVVVHKPDTGLTNSQRRLENTLGAWISLHAFYPALPTADQASIVSMLNAATPAWLHLFQDSTLYDPLTGKFRTFSDGSYDDPSTALAMGLLFLYGIVPDTGYLYIPLIHNDYEDVFTLNKYFRVDLTNHKIRIPVKAGNLVFIYGTTPLTVAFAEDGVYDVTFSTDWNMLSAKSKVADLDPRLLYAVQPSLAGLGGGTKLYKHYTEEISKRGEDVTLQTLFMEDFVDDTTGWNVKSFVNSTVKVWMVPKEERVELLHIGLALVEDAAAVTQDNIQDGDRIRDGAARTFLVKSYHDHYYQGNFIYRTLLLGRLPMII